MDGIVSSVICFDCSGSMKRNEVDGVSFQPFSLKTVHHILDEFLLCVPSNSHQQIELDVRDRRVWRVY